MQLSRRDFLKLSIPALCLPVLARVSVSGPQDKVLAAAARKAILFDASKCIGCHTCEVACKQENNLPKDATRNVVTAASFTAETGQKLYQKKQCNHCADATCVKVCPTGAVFKNDWGFVEYDKSKCSGCGYCAEYCPFHVPQMSGNSVTAQQRMDKCTGCSQRIANNQVPACTEMCPVKALTFGERDQIVTQAQVRLAEVRKNFSEAAIYGQNQLGGLNMLYILPSSPQSFGLPENPQVPIAATAWQDFLKPIGLGLGGLTLLGLGMNYIVAREAKMTRDLPDKKG